jgi:hypothetical protein
MRAETLSQTRTFSKPPLTSNDSTAPKPFFSTFLATAWYFWDVKPGWTMTRKECQHKSGITNIIQAQGGKFGTRIVNLFDLWVLLEPLCECKCVLDVALDTQGQGLKPLNEQE